MKVFVVCDEPSVQIAGDNDPVVLDLIAHLAGLVEPDNIDAAPLLQKASAIEPNITGHVLIFPEARQPAQSDLDREGDIHDACMRAVEKQTRLLRVAGTPKSQVSQLFEEALLGKKIS